MPINLKYIIKIYKVFLITIIGNTIKYNTLPFLFNSKLIYIYLFKAK